MGKPVCDVIGGRVRDEVSFSAYLFYKHGGGGGFGEDRRADEYGEVLDPEAAVREARQMIERYGFREIKLKGGVLPPDLEISSITALREEFGASYPLRIDPNCAWSVDTSVGVGRSLKDELSDGGYLEDPCPHLEGMAEVKRRLLTEDNTTPLASNVAVTYFADVPKARNLDAVQIVCGRCHTPAVFLNAPRSWERWNDVFADMTRRGANGTTEQLVRVTTYFLENLTLKMEHS